MPEPKILHISSPGYRSAGKLAFDIHKEFMDQGYESFIVSKDDNLSFANSDSYYGSSYFKLEKTYNKLKNKIKNIFRIKEKQDIKYGYHLIDHNNFQLPYRNILNKAPFKPDIIIIYAVHEFINAKTIRRIKEKSGAELFWIFYDMAPMTGGCHYSWNCEAFSDRCGKCPWLFSDKNNDISRKNLDMKNNYLGSTDINILICSKWLMEKAKKSSFLKNKPLYKWMMPIDLAVFKKRERSEVKKELGLNSTKKYVFFGSVNLKNPRKGTEYLIKATEMLYS
ncbi:MAG: hypothetical protein R6V47_02535, partial [Candidatus Delongbacteria bacterium]